MKIQLSDHFTYKRLLRFVLSPIAMMVFTSIYSVVDGFFVSNFAGENPFAAVNLIFPFIMILGAFGFMLGAGGTAVVSKTLGEGDEIKARKYFTLLVLFTFSLGVVLAVIGCAVAEPVAVLLGSRGGKNSNFDGDITDLCVLYARINFIALPFFMLQNMFQSFFITAEKPKTGFAITVGAGLTNIVLDALLVGVFKMGLFGAALATALSQTVGGVLPLFLFGRKNYSNLYFTKTKWYGKVILKSCTNGSSELLSNVASSVVGMLFNFQLLAYVGMNGVSAYGVVMYVQFVFAAIFIGYTIGVAPVVGYNFGAKNVTELRNVFRKSIVFVTMSGFAMFFLSECLAFPLAKLFVGYNDELCSLTVSCMRYYAMSFLFCGINMFGSAFFTALGNGLISAIISFVRTLVFQTSCVLLLPKLLGSVNGVWLSVVLAEMLSAVLTVVFLVAKANKYGYAGRLPITPNTLQ